MTETLPSCTACQHQLGADDRFCSKCGSPTALEDDPDATLEVEDSPSPGAPDAGGGDEAPPPAVRPSMASFNIRLQHILGEDFELLSLLGRGGFAIVYRARDRRLDRTVAIKVIRPDMVGTKLFKESFRNEGVALAKLRHPGIVPIYDICERGGLIYYVMPFVQGITLEERLSQGRPAPYETRRILSELCDALAAAHRAGLAHLDIKPDNVFLEGDLRKVLLVDFGIAMAVAETVPDSYDGPIVGTPAYMSPEQAQGLAEIDHRSDIYSLGVLGYRMLMGRPPFSGKPEDVLKKHIEEAPVSIREINPSIPKGLADAIMRCMAKDPWDRFHTVKELGDVLESVTFSTQRETTSTEAHPGWTGSLATLIAVTALLVGILVGRALG